MHKEVCNALTSSFQIRNHMIRYAVIASVCVIMTREDSSWSCFNLASKLIAYTPCHMPIFLQALVAIINITVAIQYVSGCNKETKDCILI